MEYRAAAVFERLFGDSGSTERAPREARLRQRKSILDSVMDELAHLAREIGPQDQIKVDEYTQAVRDIERRIQMAEEQSGMELPFMEQPQGVPPVFEDHVELMLDLQFLAFQTDLTRVITFMFGKEQSARPYPQIGVPKDTTRCRTTTTLRSWSRACPRSTAIMRNCLRGISRSCRLRRMATVHCWTI